MFSSILYFVRLPTPCLPCQGKIVIVIDVLSIAVCLISVIIYLKLWCEEFGGKLLAEGASVSQLVMLVQ